MSGGVAFHASASILWTAAVIVIAAITARYWSPSALLDRISIGLNLDWAPMVAGAITSLVIVTVWGSFRAIPLLHDGIAYLTQARIFSTFHLYGSPRPLPEFFEQYHMFVTPKFMAKYPPGQSLILLPGVWMGLPSFMPVLLAGVTGALTFSLARRLANAWVALLTWTLWTTAPGVLSFLPSYLSETTTGALWLAGWWALLQWRQSARRGYLFLLTTCIGWGFLTHPFTWLLYAIPTGLVVLVTVVRRRAWMDLFFAFMLGCLSVSLLAAWSERTMGTGFELPWSVYAQTYFPWDHLGFSYDSTPPRRELPPDMIRFAESKRGFYAKHTVEALPALAATRLGAILVDAFGGWRSPLAPFVVVGLIGVGAEFGFALVTVTLVFAGFLLYGYDPSWTAYYVEMYPVLAFATALGLWRFMCPVREPHMTLRQIAACTSSRPASTALLVLGTFLLPACIQSVWRARRTPFISSQPIVEFAASAAVLPGDHIMIFVRYDTSRTTPDLVSNDADLEHARVWSVHDRGPDDIRLIRLAPNRIPYLFDEASNSFTLLDTSQLRPPASSSRLLAR